MTTMPELTDLLALLETIKLDRFAAAPETAARRLAVPADAPVRVAVLGPHSGAVLNCLVRDTLFADTGAPTELRFAAQPALTLPAGEADAATVQLDDPREWKPLQRAGYLKTNLIARVVEWAAAPQRAAKDRATVSYPFANPFAQPVVLANFRDDADVVVDTCIVQRVDGAEQLAVSTSLGVLNGLQPTKALGAALAGSDAPELRFFDTMVSRLLVPVVARAAADRAAAAAGVREQVAAAAAELRRCSEALAGLATGLEQALPAAEPPAAVPVERPPAPAPAPAPADVPEGAAPVKEPPAPTPDRIQLRLTPKVALKPADAAQPEAPAPKAPSASPTPSAPAVPKEVPVLPYIAGEAAEAGWRPTASAWKPTPAAAWAPRKDEWRPHESTYVPAGSTWKAHQPEWQSASE